MLKQTNDTERQLWLQKRNSGIGGSDAACVVGLNPWKTNLRLWEEKCGIVEADDISESPVVKYGVAAEPLLRELFKIDFPQYEVSYDQYGMNRNKAHEFIFATLDGSLVERETGRKGILEIKTSAPQNKAAWGKWKDAIPEYYYCQICHQLLANEDCEFAILKAQLKGVDGDSVTRHYTFERANCLDDMKWLMEKEIQFWNAVTNKTRPPMILPHMEGWEEE